MLKRTNLLARNMKETTTKMKPWEGCCQRCDTKTNTHIMSMFNTELICMGCKREETERPDYESARDAEMAEVRKGNYNFPGVGDDL